MNLANKIESDRLTMINFHASWCGPCIAMKPHLDETVAKYGVAIHYERVDIDRNPGLAKIFEIRGVPTTMLYKSGKMKWRHSGVLSSQQLTEIVNENL
ncbi:thioredoxin family protein [Sphingobacterium sp. DR205]|uniref:thioredoxin family protein n=1 Tax=Sphingobacterium sp. DR205 TaxID=2713573 RepID=UPI0013E4973A|nr:thioredoxin family protein [Sphingobacterium sp. DR205]QIH34594.1 thioredoxin family protein [Sphingobacterium sp. DR205]